MTNRSRVAGVRVRTAALVVSTVFAALGAGCGSTDDEAGPGDGGEGGQDDSSGVLVREYGDSGEELNVCRARSDRPGALVVLLHGVTTDASPKDHPGLMEWCDRLAGQGLTVAVPNYRPAVEGSPEATDQIAAAVAYVRAHADELRVAPGPIGLVGFSAGGQEWVRAASDRRNAPVGALVGMYALVEPSGPPTAGGSLSAMLRERPVPTLLAVGAQDTAPGIRESFELFRQRGRGLAVRVLEHPDAGHAFDLAPRDARAEEIIGEVDAFLVSELTG